MTNRVLVVAAHPDDEVLGCGGTIARHRSQGDEVHVLILAEGITSRSRENAESGAKKLSDLAMAAEAAHKILGTSSLSLEKIPDNRMDSVDFLDVVKIVERFVKSIDPHIIYTHHSGDLNIDHQITHGAVATAARPLPGSKITQLLAFEVPSSTEWQTSSSRQVFTPNLFINISDTMALKLQALRAYESEMRPWPHPRSIEGVEHLAKWRGASVGVDSAESFMVCRNIIY